MTQQDIGFVWLVIWFGIMIVGMWLAVKDSECDCERQRRMEEESDDR